MCKCSSSWRSLRETPATSNSGYKALGIPAQCPSAPIRSRTPQQCFLCSAHWVSEHNISVSGNPSQQVISSRQPVIYSKCLNELKRVSSGLTFLVLADRSLHCFLLFNKICLCHRGLQIFLTLCCLPGNSRTMNLNRKHILSLLSSITFIYFSWHSDFIFICVPHYGCFFYFTCSI